MSFKFKDFLLCKSTISLFKLYSLREFKLKMPYLTGCKVTDFVLVIYYSFRLRRHIFSKYAQHNHLRYPMMSEVSLKT